jgi:hypothetical protein
VARPTVTLEVAGNDQLARDLAAGGVFVPGCTLAMNEDCELVVRGGGDEVVLAARVVWVDSARGAGLQLLVCDPATRTRLEAMTAAPPPEPPPEPEEEAEREDDHEPHFASAYERLRGLSLAQQLKTAQSGDVTERIALERIYGKTVWEALLRNPRLTVPEVTRIARMATLPKVLIEVIVGNAAWLQVPEIRRALLRNTRIATDQIHRVLRLLSKPELKVITGANAYPFAVRDAAKRMLRD